MKKVSVLNVAEKPSVAKDISKILSGDKFKTTSTTTNYVHTFTYNHYNMTFIPVSGHLKTYTFTNKGIKVVEEFFEESVERAETKKAAKLVTLLKKYAKRCKLLFLWLDTDLEGESIAQDVYDICIESNSKIRVQRAMYLSTEKSEITKAMENLTNINEKYVDAVSFRQEIDFRSGLAFVRILTYYLRKSFEFDPPLKQHSIFSLGLVEGELLNLIVSECDKVPVESIKVTLDDDSTFKWSGGDTVVADAVYEEINGFGLANLPVTVKTVKEKKENRALPPLTTWELLVQGSRYLDMRCSEIMETANSLHKKEAISYPRTESDSFPNETMLKEIVERQVNNLEWGSYAMKLRDNITIPKVLGTDANYPFPIHPLEHLSHFVDDTNMRKLYKFVACYFLGYISQPITLRHTEVDIEICGHKFSASGRVIESRGYLDIFSHGEPKGLSIKKFLTTDKPKLKEITKFKPSHLGLTEADVLTLMKNHRLGKPSTYVSHLTNLVDRDHMVRDEESKTLLPSQFGRGLINGFREIGVNFIKAGFREKLEKDVVHISKGEKEKRTVLEEYKGLIKSDCLKIRSSISILLKSVEKQAKRSNILHKCVECDDSYMVLGHLYVKKPHRPELQGKKYWLIACFNYPECQRAICLPPGIFDVQVCQNSFCEKCTDGPDGIKGRCKMIEFRFHPGAIEDPDLDSRLTFTKCIHCYKIKSREGFPAPDFEPKKMLLDCKQVLEKSGDCWGMHKNWEGKA